MTMESVLTSILRRLISISQEVVRTPRSKSSLQPRGLSTGARSLDLLRAARRDARPPRSSAYAPFQVIRVFWTGATCEICIGSHPLSSLARR